MTFRDEQRKHLAALQAAYRHIPWKLAPPRLYAHTVINGTTTLTRGTQTVAFTIEVACEGKIGAWVAKLIPAHDGVTDVSGEHEDGPAQAVARMFMERIRRANAEISETIALIGHHHDKE